MPRPLRDFLAVLVGSASVLGIIYVGMTLTFGQQWVEANASSVFTHGLYWLLIPPALWALRARQESKAGFQSPKIKVIMKDGLIITEPCDWMGHRTAISVFKIQDEVELFEFLAFVVNIQSNKLVQIRPNPSEGQDINIAYIESNKEKLVFKPGHVA